MTSASGRWRQKVCASSAGWRPSKARRPGCTRTSGDNLRYADAFFDDRFRPLFDAFAERSGEDFPPAEIERFEHEVPEVTALDLAAEGISTVLWTSGYRPVLDWIHMPVLDTYGLPIQTGGRSLVDGLCFIGTPWLIDMGSANLIGLVRDAKNLVGQI